MARPKGPDKPPVIPTKEYNESFIEMRSKQIKSIEKNLTKMEARDKRYWQNMLEALDASVKSKYDLDAKIRGDWRYTPRQMYNAIYAYFKISIEACQPIGLTAIGLYCGLGKTRFSELINDKHLIPELGFLKDCVDFVENYIEFTGQKKQNPAFNIFWLKNRGWKDKFEIEASSTQGALSEEEREQAQQRIKQFSEVQR